MGMTWKESNFCNKDLFLTTYYFHVNVLISSSWKNQVQLLLEKSVFKNKTFCFAQPLKWGNCFYEVFNDLLAMVKIKKLFLFWTLAMCSCCSPSNTSTANKNLKGCYLKRVLFHRNIASIFSVYPIVSANSR